MTTLRVQRASLTAQPQVKIRVHKASLTAAGIVVTALRVHKASLTMVEGVIATVTSALTVGPGEPVEITADLLTSGSPTWAWRRISGPTIGLAPAGDTLSFNAPSIWNADQSQPTSGAPGVAVLVLGVTATVGGVTSPEVRCEVTILPQLSWTRGVTSWVGSRVAPA